MPAPFASRYPGEYVLCRVVQPDPFGPVLGYLPTYEKTPLGPRETDLFDDFLYAQWNATAANGPFAWHWAAAGAGAVPVTSTAGVDAQFEAMGVLDMPTGTTAAGINALYQPANMLLGLGVFDFTCRVTFDALSTAADEYVAVFGFHDDLATGTDAPADGVYFRYNRASHGDFWATVTRANSVESVNVSTVAPPLEGEEWHTLRIFVPTPDRAFFYVNGVQLAGDAGAKNTNIPTGAGRHVGMVAKIFKTVGTTSRHFYIDWCRLRWRGRERPAA